MIRQDIVKNKLSEAVNLSFLNKYLEAAQIASEVADSVEYDNSDRAFAANFAGSINYTVLRNYDEAMKYYKLSVELSPEDPTFLSECAGFLIQMNIDIDKAKLLNQKALDLFNPNDFCHATKMKDSGITISGADEFLTNAYAVFGNYHLMKGKETNSSFHFYEAEKYFKKAIEVNGYITYPYFKLADLYKQEGDLTSSLGAWNRGVCVDKYFLTQDTSMLNVYRDMLYFLANTRLEACGLVAHALNSIGSVAAKCKLNAAIRLSSSDTEFIFDAILKYDFFRFIIDLVKATNQDKNRNYLLGWCIEVCLGNLWQADFYNHLGYHSNDENIMIDFVENYGKHMMFIETEEINQTEPLDILASYNSDNGLLSPRFLSIVQYPDLKSEDIVHIKTIWLDINQKICQGFYNSTLFHKILKSDTEYFVVNENNIQTAIIIHLASNYHSKHLRNILTNTFNLVDVLYEDSRFEEIYRRSLIESVGKRKVEEIQTGINNDKPDLMQLEAELFKIYHQISIEKLSEEHIIDKISAYIKDANSKSNDLIKLTQALYIDNLIGSHAKCLLDSYYLFRYYNKRYINALKLGTAFAFAEFFDTLFPADEAHLGNKHFKKFLLFIPSYIIGEIIATNIDKLLDSKIDFEEFRKEFYFISGKNVLASRPVVFIEKK